MEKIFKIFILLLKPLVHIIPLEILIYKGFPGIKIIGKVDAALKPLTNYLHFKLKESKRIKSLQKILISLPQGIVLQDRSLFDTLAVYLPQLLAKYPTGLKPSHKPSLHPILIPPIQPPIFPLVYPNIAGAPPEIFEIFPTKQRMLGYHPPKHKTNIILFTHTLNPEIPIHELINRDKDTILKATQSILNSIDPNLFYPDITISEMPYIEHIPFIQYLTNINYPGFYVTRSIVVFEKHESLTGQKVLLASTCPCGNFLFDSTCTCTRTMITRHLAKLEALPQINQIYIKVQDKLQVLDKREWKYYVQPLLNA